MLDLLLSSVEYGGYVSIVKFVVFLTLFFLWLPLLGWVNRDAKAVETNQVLWTAIVFGTTAAAALIWLIVPIFIIGMLFYLIAVSAASIAYVTHRNTRVLDFDRVLTTEHIKGLLVNKQKRLKELKSFVFVTANNNEVPVPEPKTAEFFGFKAAYDTLTDATWRRASKILLVPAHEDYKVTYEVDGAALKQPSIDRERGEYFIRFIKNLADLDISEKRKPQKGKFAIQQNKENTEWEATTAGSTVGEQIQLKAITHSDIAKLADIGLMPDQYQQLSELQEVKQGLFIVSGPKKAGVTTTFYALLRSHDAFTNSINTLEKKPSSELPNITQNVFTLSDTATTTYAKRLETVVRMGPDIVGIGDCEDSETARIACEAAKDGKIVYVRLEAEDTVKAIGKWMKLVGDKDLLAKTLLGISNQRLVRKLCLECRQAYAPNRELLRKFNIPAKKAKVFYRPGKVQLDKHGKPVICENCQGTGFVSRTGVFQIITIDDQLREAIKQSKSLSEIGSQFRRAKMLYLQEQALRKVIDGTTGINEIIRVFSTSKKQKGKKAEHTT